MRITNSIIPTALFLLLLSFGSFAQVTDVCGTDTIVLRTSNYHYGTIQWESSYDNITWAPITGANDTVYKFYPGETKYYRAVAFFYDCPPVGSAVSLVQIPPVAHAGSNRTVNGNAAFMMANKITGAQGTWSVISGSGGSFADVNDPYTEFQGADSLYKLVWTLSNACGTSKDTITVQFKQNVYFDAIVIVDSTDVMLSDSAQLAQGIYIIQFSSPQPTITDSTVLIGLINEGFIRKVDSFSVQTNTHTIYTSQGTLEDITISGVYDVAQVFDVDTTVSGSSKSTNLTRLDYLPTRAELLSDPKYKTGRFYYVVENEPAYLHPGVTLNSNKEGGNLIDINFNNSIFNTGSSSLALSGYYKFNPNIVADFDYGWFKVKYFNIGMNNGVIEQNIQLAFDASGSTTVLDKNFTIFSASKNIIMILGLVPVWVQAKISLDGKASLEANAAMNITHGYTKTTTLNASIDYQNGSWSYNYDEDSKTETTNQILVSGDMTQNFDIGPKISFKIYGIVGPELDVRLTEELKLCFKNTNWKADLNLGGDLTLGAKAEVFGKSLFDVSKTWSQGFYSLSLPDKLQGISGNNQHYTLGDTLAKKTRVRVRSSKGTPVPGVVVKFQPKNGGTVADSLVISDLQGYAETVWTPGGATESKMEAYVWECDSSHINNSPIVFTAIANQVTPTPDCAQSSLSVSVSKNGNVISPVASMGSAPYAYATDGINFSSQKPEIIPQPGATYTFTVRDSENCLASAAYTAATDPCFSSNLSMDVQIIGNYVVASANGGRPPFIFSLNSSSGPFSPIGTFNNLPQGNHTIFVKDSANCLASRTFTIETVTIPVFADFTSNITNAVVGTPIVFTNLSNNATTYLWDFGDGITSTDESPIHTYSNSGSYNVTLYAYNNQLSDTLLKPNYITITLGTGCGIVTDIDGNVYQTIQHGNQCWMKENLKVTRYADGTPIPYKNIDTAWIYMPNNSKAFCYYGFNSGNEATYGALYTWIAVLNGTTASSSNPSGIQGVCPTGWHVPSEAEWDELDNYLFVNGYNWDGSTSSYPQVSKSMADSVLWAQLYTVTGAPGTDLHLNNSSEFSARPGGKIESDGQFSDIEVRGYWWTASSYAKSKIIYTGHQYLEDSWGSNASGYSVRCVKN